LPYAGNVLEIWGGEVRAHPLPVPEAPKVLSDDGSGMHEYALFAVAANGKMSAASPVVKAKGKAWLRWDNLAVADAFCGAGWGEDWAVAD
jgi:hypothetical protein